MWGHDLWQPKKNTGFVSLRARTISFVERGLERLDPGQ